MSEPTEHPYDSGDLLSKEAAAKYLLPALIAGLGGASLGGITSARSKERPGETPAERRARILRNALGMGLGGAALGGSVAGLLHLIPNLAPKRTIWEDRTAGMADNLGHRLLAGAGGAAGGAALGRGLGLVGDSKNVPTVNDMLDAGYDNLEKPKLVSALKERRAAQSAAMAKGTRYGAALGGAAMLGLPEIATHMDSTGGSIIGGTAGGMGLGSLARGMGKGPKTQIGAAILGALGGAYLPRAGAVEDEIIEKARAAFGGN